MLYYDGMGALRTQGVFRLCLSS